MMRWFTSIVAVCASSAFAALGPMPTANLFWNDTTTMPNLMFDTGDGYCRFLQVPPDPFAGNTECVLEGVPGNESTASLGFYGTDVQIISDNNTLSSFYIDGTLQSVFNNTDQKGELAWGFHKLQLRFAEDNSTHLRQLTFTRGMETNAPTMADVRKTTVYLVKNGKPNTESPYLQLPWNDYERTVLTQTPVIGGQVAAPFEALQIMHWAAHPETLATNFNPPRMVIQPPANTSYLAVNATLGPDGAYFQVYINPYFPGLSPGHPTPLSAFHTHNPDYYLSNARVYELPLDPKVQYNISFVSMGLWERSPSPIFSSVTFYSSLWDGDGNSNSSSTNGTAGSENTATNGAGTTGPENNATGSAAVKLSAGAIAGAVVAVIIGVLLIAALVFFLWRKKRQTDLERKWNQQERPSIDYLVEESEEAKRVEPYVMPKTLSSTGGTHQTNAAAISQCIEGSSSTQQALWEQEGRRLLALPGGPELLSPQPLKFLSGSSTQGHEQSLPASSSSSPRPTSSFDSPQARQEEDMGLLEEVMSEQESLVPPSYNPLWEDDARRRGKIPTSAVQNVSSSNAPR